MTIVYHENKLTGALEKFEIERRAYKPSYDSQIDKPMHQRILDNYKKFESDGTLRPTDIIHSKSYMRQVHEDALARGD